MPPKERLCISVRTSVAGKEGEEGRGKGKKGTLWCFSPLSSPGTCARGCDDARGCVQSARLLVDCSGEVRSHAHRHIPRHFCSPASSSTTPERRFPCPIYHTPRTSQPHIKYHISYIMHLITVSIQIHIYLYIYTYIALNHLATGNAYFTQ